VRAVELGERQAHLGEGTAREAGRVVRQRVKSEQLGAVAGVERGEAYAAGDEDQAGRVKWRRCRFLRSSWTDGVSFGWFWWSTGGNCGGCVLPERLTPDGSLYR
jgi:hypothetical protein